MLDERKSDAAGLMLEDRKSSPRQRRRAQPNNFTRLSRLMLAVRPVDYGH
jgi:hypothetical protein